MDVATVAVVHHRVQTGISQNHCSSGNWPTAPPTPPAAASMLSISMARPGGRMSRMVGRASQPLRRITQSRFDRADGHRAVTVS